MARADAVEQLGVVERYNEAVARLKAPGDIVMVVRGVPRSIVMQCPDGCGDLVTINVDRRSGPAWRFYERRNRLTIFPSVWRDSGCRAHFIVWNNQILWCDHEENTTQTGLDPELVSAVQRCLPTTAESYRHFEDIAVELEAVPWDVLWACRSLERLGSAESSERGTKFRNAPPRAPSRRIDIKI